jgi:hypothetical protein
MLTPPVVSTTALAAAAVATTATVDIIAINFFKVDLLDSALTGSVFSLGG